MDLEILQGVAEVFVVTIPLIVVGGLLLLSRSRLGEAIARRICRSGLTSPSGSSAGPMTIGENCRRAPRA
jgi:hypothetical protein